MAENELKQGDPCCLKSNTKIRFTIVSIENGIAKCVNDKMETVDMPLIALKPIGFSGIVSGIYDD